jgi:hypothetical protein
MSFIEKAIYFIWNIFSLGFPFLMKIVIKKAVIEALKGKK